ELTAQAENRLLRLVDCLRGTYSGDRFGRAVERSDSTGWIDRDEAGSDRLEDQVSEGLEIREMLALVLHVLVQLVILPREGSGQHRDDQEHARVHEDGQHFDRGVL